MALVYDTTPIDTTWTQDGPVQGSHTTTIRVSNFVATTYYAMVAELYADPGFPAFGSTPDPVIQNHRLSRWDITRVYCDPGGDTTKNEIHMLLTYQVQSPGGFVSVPNKDGPVIFRQRSVPQDVETDFDRNNAQMIATYKNQPQAKRWTRQKSLMLYECERLEEANPEPRVRPLLDHVNSLVWNGRALRTVLFADFQSDTRDDGNTFVCQYSFLYDAGTHDPVLPFINPDGNPPEDLTVAGNEAATITPEVIPQADFAPLNIVIPI